MEKLIEQGIQLRNFREGDPTKQLALNVRTQGETKKISAYRSLLKAMAARFGNVTTANGREQ